jgi:hypothetical protein
MIYTLRTKIIKLTKWVLNNVFNLEKKTNACFFAARLCVKNRIIP